MKLSDYKFSKLDKFFLKWETRDLGANFDRLALIMPCVIYSDKMRLDSLFERTQVVLSEFFKLTDYVVPKLMRRIALRLIEYKSDDRLYLQDRSKMFDFLLQNVQLYGVVIDVCNTPESSYILQTFADVLKEKYDKEYTLNSDGERILDFQEKYSV